MKIALTGGIACGKSLLSRFLNELGVETLDADDIVHEIIPDPAERRRIAAEVFADPEKRKALEAGIHPLVKERIERWLDEGDNVVRDVGDARDERPSSLTPLASLTPPNLKIAIIPLLFEVHWEKNFDIISCVVSKRESQIERMVTTRSMTRAEAEARLAVQLPVEEKARRSHYVIRNDGSPDELREEARSFVEWISRQVVS